MIVFGQILYSIDQIKAGDKGPLPPEFEQGFQFCRRWLNGQDRFSLQTSGSTGEPKIIEVYRKQLLSSVNATRQFFKVKKGWKLLCCLDLDKIAGKMMLLRALEWEAHLWVHLPAANPLENLMEVDFDFVAMVPLQAEACLNNSRTKEALNKIKNLIIGGASISVPLKEALSNLKGSVYQSYGMTETVSHIALADVKKPGPLVYQTLPGVELKIDGEQRLQVRAPMTGDQWLPTNDMVQMISSASFIWKGRADFVINSGGIKIHPEEITAKLSGLMQEFFPGKKYFFTGRPDHQLGQSLIAVVEGVDDKKVGKAFLNQAKAILPRYKNPKDIVFVTEIKITSSGKIDQLRTLATWKN
ncbi:AMP-binding protein [Cyclobacterium plantarum]|uniref:AMP-binding protein n=1 Tax=Cyclobacterium plantarum TaxID=2716263 RepID=A0ABX0H8T1_9BACT|nr:AMP-binding protein [Cyclobacterium plantarum]NHE56375.1 AMP-binding protein [Cyclobacterium plantarum]